MKKLILLLATLIAVCNLSAEPLKKGAQCNFDHSSHDFGVVEHRGRDLQHTFNFVNDGTSPLLIMRVVTSCSCVKVKYPKKPVAVGETGVVRVTYEVRKKEKGVFNKVVQLFTNTSKKREMITFRGVSEDNVANAVNAK